MKPNKNQVFLLVSFVIVFTVFGMFFRTPTYDDGIHSFTVQNTINWQNPFYNNYEQVKHPFQRLQFGLIALGYSFGFPISFIWPSILHGIMLILSTLLVYKISKTYWGLEKRIFATWFYFYLIYTEYWISPTRPEIYLSTILLTITYCFNQIERINKQKMIIIVSMLIGCIGLTFHSNSWILYIYLIIFTLSNRSLFTKREIIFGFISIFFCSLVGLTIIFYPNPDETFRFLLRMSQEGGNRITFLKNEIQRFRFLFITTPYKYLFFYFLFLSFIYLKKERCSYGKLIRTSYNKYNNIFILGISVFIGLGFLPSARWGVYLTYYYLPITFICTTIIYDTLIEKNERYFIIVPVLFLASLYVLRNFNEIDNYHLIKFCYFYIPLIILSFSYKKLRIPIIYYIMILGLCFKSLEMYQRHVIFKEVKDYLNRYENELFVTNVQFNWERKLVKGLVPIELNYQRSITLDNGKALIGSKSSWVRVILTGKDCDFKPLYKIKSSSTKYFITPFLQDLIIYKYSCDNNNFDPIGGELSLKEYIEEQLNQD